MCRPHDIAPAQAAGSLQSAHTPRGCGLQPSAPLQTGKSDDWEREAFDYVKYSKMSFSSAVIGPVAVAALFRRGMGARL